MVQCPPIVGLSFAARDTRIVLKRRPGRLTFVFGLCWTWLGKLSLFDSGATSNKEPMLLDAMKVGNPGLKRPPCEGNRAGFRSDKVYATSARCPLTVIRRQFVCRWCSLSLHASSMCTGYTLETIVRAAQARPLTNKCCCALNVYIHRARSTAQLLGSSTRKSSAC
jgi:hypothetical protein